MNHNGSTVASFSTHHGAAVPPLPERWWSIPQLRQALATYDMGVLIDAVIRGHRLTQREVADALGYSQAWVSRVVNGHQSIVDIQQIRKIAICLSIPLPTGGAITGLPQPDAVSDSVNCWSEPQVNDSFTGYPPSESDDATKRSQFVNALGLSWAGAQVSRVDPVFVHAEETSARLSRKLETSQVGPATIEHLNMAVANFAASWETAYGPDLFQAMVGEYEIVAAMIDQTHDLRWRKELFRVAGWLAALVGFRAFDLGSHQTARCQLITASQLAKQVGDARLFAWTQMAQGTIALWTGNYLQAIAHAQAGQDHATGSALAQLAARCESRAYARMGNERGMREALARAEAAMPALSRRDDPGGACSFSPAALEMYAGISFLWLAEASGKSQYAAEASPRLRSALTGYETALPQHHSPPNEAQIRINIALTLLEGGQVEQACQLAVQSLGAQAETAPESNLHQALEFASALRRKYPTLAKTREVTDRLRAVLQTRATLALPTGDS